MKITIDNLLIMIDKLPLKARSFALQNYRNSLEELKEIQSKGGEALVDQTKTIHDEIELCWINTRKDVKPN